MSLPEISTINALGVTQSCLRVGLHGVAGASSQQSRKLNRRRLGAEVGTVDLDNGSGLGTYPDQRLTTEPRDSSGEKNFDSVFFENLLKLRVQSGIGNNLIDICEGCNVNHAINTELGMVGHDGYLSSNLDHGA